MESCIWPSGYFGDRSSGAIHLDVASCLQGQKSNLSSLSALAGIAQKQPLLVDRARTIQLKK